MVHEAHLREASLRWAHLALSSLDLASGRHPVGVATGKLTPDERYVAIASLGLAVTAAGAFLPWARIGGRNRSGFDTADTFIALADGALPDAIAWIGRWWYAPAFLVVLAWATVFASGRRSLRVAGVLSVVIALAMWWLFVWAGANWNLLNTKLIGPLIATTGLVVVGAMCTRPRAGLLSDSAAGTEGPKTAA